MNGFDRERMITALIMLVTALFVGRNIAPPGWHGPLRWAAIIGFLFALALALGEIGLWLRS